jgi:thioredoxin-dependent peroxiredoxin
VQIFGVSFDSVEDNRKFAEKLHFPFRLLSDPRREMGVAFGAADKRDTAYARRVAYLIENGKITHAYDVKDPAGHAARVLADVGR